MEARRLAPWIASLVVHAVVILMPIAYYDLTPPAVNRTVTVDIDLVGETVQQRGRGAKTAPGPAVPTDTRPASPGGALAASPDAIQPTPTGPAASVSPRVGRSVSPLGGVPQAPPASDVLEDLAKATGKGESSTAAATATSSAAGGAQIGWVGSPRKLLRKRNPQFPVILSAAGQEVEGEARITVAPTGIVTRVEITRSSGYIEIDASVEAALRDYLFSRVNGRSDTVGTVRFRFRLEKTD